MPSSPFKVLLIDNYDSFTYNLVHYLQDVSERVEVEVVRNDALTAKEALGRPKPSRCRQARVRQTKRASASS